MPVVNIGTRQHGRHRAKSVIDCEYDKKMIKESFHSISKTRINKNYYKNDLWKIGFFIFILYTGQFAFHE